MTKMKIDLQHDPLIPTGRDLIEHLVAAHMVAKDDEELLHMVGVSLSEVFGSKLEDSLRIMTHAAYRAQEIIVDLLDVGAERGVALDNANAGSGGSGLDAERVRQERLALWMQVRGSATQTE